MYICGDIAFNKNMRVHIWRARLKNSHLAKKYNMHIKNTIYILNILPSTKTCVCTFGELALRIHIWRPRHEIFHFFAIDFAPIFCF